MHRTGVSLALTACLSTLAHEAHARPRSSQPIRDQLTTHGAPLSPSQSFYYFGGKVIPRVEVVVVLWGSKVSSTAAGLGSFYQAVVASPYLDWLGEYDTISASTYDGQSGSNQHVYRGTYKSTVTITPSSSSSSIEDATIASELESKIGSSALPTPTIDSEGGVDTLYMVYFPPGAVIYDGQGGVSCQNFCGYHGTFQMTVGNQTVSVPYGVIPDMTSSGCSCGGNGALEDYTITSSHELAESITDAEIGVASGVGRPMAFYDANNGEIGDICANTYGALDTISGYTVQKNWSQRLGQCIAQDPSLPVCGSQRPCKPCSSDADCGSGMQCSNDACVPAPPPSPDAGGGGSSGASSDAGPPSKPSPSADGGASGSSSGGDDSNNNNGGSGSWNKSSGCTTSPAREGGSSMTAALALFAALGLRRRRR